MGFQLVEDDDLAGFRGAAPLAFDLAACEDAIGGVAGQELGRAVGVHVAPPCPGGS